MKHLRKEDISLYYYIKDKILCDFVEKEEAVPLGLMEMLSTPNIDSTTPSYVYEAQTTMLPNPIERGRGWVYFDASDDGGSGLYITVSGTRADGLAINGVKEQSNRIVVYNDYTIDTSGTITHIGILPEDEYMVDYIDGRIVTSGTASYTPRYVDYHWHYVSVVDEWAAVQAADPPVVVIDIQGTDKGGYQLGGGRMVTRKVDIHIFASNMAERNDLVETLYDGFYLKSAPILDIPLGTALDYDGTWYWRRNNTNKLETLFDIRTVRDAEVPDPNGCAIGNMRFDNVTTRHISLPLIMTRSRDEVMLSDLNAYRSKISFDLVSYTDI